MHTIEPYFNWRNLYTSAGDERSPFYQREYSEFEFTNRIYDHAIHPQWDEFGSETLLCKILFAEYEQGYAVIEMLGEWNDCIENDIMMFKREVVEPLMAEGVNKFCIIGENVLNFHPSDELYYEEWFEEVNEENGWIAVINFREHIIREFSQANIDSYFVMGGQLDDLAWRTQEPATMYERIANIVAMRLGVAR